MSTTSEERPRVPNDRREDEVLGWMQSDLREFGAGLAASIQKLERHGLDLKGNRPTVVYQTKAFRYILTIVPADSHFLLTTREARIAELVSEGWANSQIADELQIKRSTVAAFVRRILKKTGARNRVELTRFMLCADLRNRGAVRQPAPTTGGA